MIKNIIGRLVVMLFMLTTAITMQGATDYGITVAGVKVTSDNASNITGTGIKSGKVTYSSGSKTLTLNNATINYSSGYGIGVKTDGVTIKVVGNCTIFGTFAINLDESAIIDGGNSGSLTLRCSIDGLYVNNAKKLTIRDVTMDIYGTTGSGSLRGGSSNTAQLEIDHSTLTVTNEGSSNPCVKGFASCLMNDCGVESKGIFFNSQLKGFGSKSMLTSGPLSIRAASESYGVTVAGHQVNDVTVNNFCFEQVSGTLDYYWQQNELRIENMTADCHGTAPALVFDKGFDNGVNTSAPLVMFVGNNTFTNTNGIGIMVDGFHLKVKVITDMANKIWGKLEIPDGRMMLIDMPSDGVTILNGNMTMKSIRSNKPTLVELHDDTQLKLTGDETGTLYNVNINKSKKYYGLVDKAGDRVSRLVKPAGAYVENKGGTAQLITHPLKGGEMVTGEVLFQPVNDYLFELAQVPVYSSNADDILSGMDCEGKASYDAETKTLTLDNVVLPTAPGNVPYYDIDCPPTVGELDVMLIGDNYLNRAGNGAYFCADTTIVKSSDGKGSLTVSGWHSNNTYINDCSIESPFMWEDDDTNQHNDAEVTRSDIRLTGDGVNPAWGVLRGFGKFTGPDMLVLDPEGAYYDTNKRQLVKDGEPVATFAFITYKGSPSSQGVSTISTSSEDSRYYNLSGQQLRDAHRGIVIEKNGKTTRKVLAK